MRMRFSHVSKTHPIHALTLVTVQCRVYHVSSKPFEFQNHFNPSLAVLHLWIVWNLMWLELVLATGLKELVFVDGYKFQGNDEYVVSENWKKYQYRVIYCHSVNPNMVEIYSHIDVANSSLTTAFLEVLFETNTLCRCITSHLKRQLFFFSILYKHKRLPLKVLALQLIYWMCMSASQNHLWEAG